MKMFAHNEANYLQASVYFFDKLTTLYSKHYLFFFYIPGNYNRELKLRQTHSRNNQSFIFIFIFFLFLKYQHNLRNNFSA